MSSIRTDTQYVFIWFHVFMEQSKNRINKAGELLVTSELSRSQRRNLEDCIEKISTIIAEASEKPREPTPEDIALRAARWEGLNIPLAHWEHSNTIHSLVWQFQRGYVTFYKYDIWSPSEKRSPMELWFCPLGKGCMVHVLLWCDVCNYTITSRPCTIHPFPRGKNHSTIHNTYIKGSCQLAKVILRLS